MICTASVLGARGVRQCVKKAIWLATDPKDGEHYYRCQEHAERCVKSFGFTLEKLPDNGGEQHGQ